MRAPKRARFSAFWMNSLGGSRSYRVPPRLLKRATFSGKTLIFSSLTLVTERKTAVCGGTETTIVETTRRELRHVQ